MQRTLGAGRRSLLALLAQRSGTLPRRAMRSAGEYLAQAGGCVGCHTEDKKERRSLRRRPRAQDAVRNVLRTEHHAASAGGDRTLDRGRLHPRDARGRRGPADHITSRRFRTRRSRRSPTAICATSGPTSARCRRAAAASQPHDLQFPVRLPVLGRGLEVALLHARRLRARPEGARRRSIAAPIWSRRWATAASATRRAISSAAPSGTASSPAARGPRARTCRTSRRPGSRSGATGS